MPTDRYNYNQGRVGLGLQRTGHDPGLHSEKFIAVVQVGGKAEIVVALAVEIVAPVRALGFIDEHGNLLFGDEKSKLLSIIL